MAALNLCLTVHINEVYVECVHEQLSVHTQCVTMVVHVRKMLNAVVQASFIYYMQSAHQIQAI